MHAYVIRRLLLMVPTLLLVSIVTFGLVHLMPGDVVDAQLADSPGLSKTDLAAARQQLGLDKSVPEQYVNWMGDLLRGDLGKSLWAKQSVASVIGDTLPITIELALVAFSVSCVMGIAIGTICAVRQDHWVDYALRLASIFGLSLPSFWIATLFVVFAARWFGYLSPLQFHSLAENPVANLKQILPPAITIAVATSAAVARMMRSSMLEVLRQDFIRTARAKGLQGRSVVTGHAVRNALIPVITVAGTQVSVLLGGSVIVETIFNLPGLGRLMLDSVNHRDFTTIQGIALVAGLVVLAMNLLVDLTYGWIDPRIRY